MDSKKTYTLLREIAASGVVPTFRELMTLRIQAQEALVELDGIIEEVNELEERITSLQEALLSTHLEAAEMRTEIIHLKAGKE